MLSLLHLAFVIFALAGAAVLPSQATHIVDAAGGGGVHSTIQSAVDAAASGDVVRIRAGQYQKFAIVGKALSLIGEAGVEILVGDKGEVSITSPPPGSRVVLRKLHFESRGLNVSKLLVTGVSGAVILDEIEMYGGFRVSEFFHVQLLVIERCVIRGQLTVRGGTNAVINQSEFVPVTIAGGSRLTVQPDTLVGDAPGGLLLVSDTTIRGAHAFHSFGTSGDAIRSNQMRVILRGTARNIIASGARTHATPNGVSGTGWLTYDPEIDISSIEWQGLMDPQRAAILSSTAAEIGSAVTVRWEGPAADRHLLLVGLPKLPVPLGTWGVLGLESYAPVRLGLGTTDHLFPVPNDPNLRGVAFGMQALTASSNGLYSLTNPTVTTVR